MTWLARPLATGWHSVITGTAHQSLAQEQLSAHVLGCAACMCLAGREWDVPVEVFDSIETLLPTGKGRFLELWAPTQAGREGWTHMVEQSGERQS